MGKEISHEFQSKFVVLRMFHNELIRRVYQKSKEDSGQEAPTTLGNYVSEIIEEEQKFSLSGRTIRDYFKTVIDQGSDQHLSLNISNALSRYLGYSDFSDFKKNNKTISNSRKKFSVLAIAGTAVVATYFGIESTSRNCMIWTEAGVYEKVDCEQLNSVPIDKDILEHFHQVYPNCSDLIKTPDGRAVLWYGKNHNGEYEFFDMLSFHPETGKSLKEVTDYIQKKHICKTED